MQTTTLPTDRTPMKCLVATESAGKPAHSKRFASSVASGQRAAFGVRELAPALEFGHLELDSGRDFRLSLGREHDMCARTTAERG